MSSSLPITAITPDQQIIESHFNSLKSIEKSLQELRVAIHEIKTISPSQRTTKSKSTLFQQKVRNSQVFFMNANREEILEMKTKEMEVKIKERDALKETIRKELTNTKSNSL